MIGLDWQGLTYGRFGTNGLVPPDIPCRGPGNVRAGTLVYHNVLDARTHRHRLIRRMLHRDEITPARESIGGNQDLGVTVLQARCHSLPPVARKTRRVDRADAGEGEHRDGCLLTHGQEHADRIVYAHPQAP